MEKSCFDRTHRFGRIGVIIGIVIMLGIPAIVSTVYDMWPENIGAIFAVGGGLLAVFLPTNIIEVLSYAPIIGSSSYIAFLTGNIGNLKLPCAMSAMAMMDVSQGSDEGDTVSSIAIATSSIVTTIVIALGVLLLAPLQPLLTDPRIQTATPYMIPALFGSLMLGMLNNSCGTYVAKRKLTCMILPVLLVAGVNLVYPLAPLIGYVMIACMGLTVGCAWVLYKLGVIQMIPKTAKKTEEKA
ncbi:hypothetical protein [Fournierella sp.]|uniref:hypothetical protein n=1 Tax=Allofournierella sp. TaxID=1940256 RepID=UPI0025C0B1F2|nr:hypothetical protein [Fournierella sp.]